MSEQLTIPEAHAFERVAQTPMELIAYAVQNHAAIDVIERLAALQEHMLDRKAENAFNDALSAAQAELKCISPNATNMETGSKWATYDALDRVVRPIYIRLGFSLSFSTAECPKPDTERILCYVSCAGHTRVYQKDIPADGKGAKGGGVMTKVHGSGAASSYGMRYLLKMIFNIAIGEEDRDGNADGEMGELSERLEWIANAKDIPELKKLYEQAKSEALEAKDSSALRLIADAKDKRKAELS